VIKFWVENETALGARIGGFRGQGFGGNIDEFLKL
jgi:hypothetical protein